MGHDLQKGGRVLGLQEDLTSAYNNNMTLPGEGIENELEQLQTSTNG